MAQIQNNPCHAEYFYLLPSSIPFYKQVCYSVDPDQIGSSEAS